jgi:nitrite reductase/ring-hydroxylating ferredoxin subunit
LHQKKFDLTTGGELTATGDCDLVTFPARVTEQDEIMVGVE